MKIQLAFKFLVILCMMCCSPNSAARVQSEWQSAQQHDRFPPEKIEAEIEARRQFTRKRNEEELARLHSQNADKTTLVRQLQRNLLCTAPQKASGEVVPLVEEWLLIYPQLPDFDKRFLAGQALVIAKNLHKGAEVELRTNQCRVFYPDDAQVRAELGERMAAVVVQSAVSGDWLVDQLQEKIFLGVATDESFDAKTRAAAKLAVQDAGTEIGRSALALVDLLDKSAQAKNTDESTRQCLRKLTALYPQLSKTEQHTLAPYIVWSDVKLLDTSLFSDAERLLWLVQRSVKSGHWVCMPVGSLESAFLEVHRMYLKSRNYEAAEELLRSVVVLRENYDDPFETSKARLVLGYFLKKRGRLHEAKEQFDLALFDVKKADNDFSFKDLLPNAYSDYISDVERARSLLHDPKENRYYCGPNSWGNRSRPSHNSQRRQEDAS